ncbi:hypothetical protein H1C71_007556, partial [Ictidomys tridecemlineatus]
MRGHKNSAPLARGSQSSRCHLPAPQLPVQAAAGDRGQLLQPVAQLSHIPGCAPWLHPVPGLVTSPYNMVIGLLWRTRMAFWVPGDTMGCLGSRMSLPAWGPWAPLAHVTSWDWSLTGVRLGGIQVTSPTHRLFASLVSLHLRQLQSSAGHTREVTPALCSPSSGLPDAHPEPKGCPNPDKDREDPCRSCILQGAVLPGSVIQVVLPLQGGVHTPIQPCAGGMTQKTPLSRTKLTHSISPPGEATSFSIPFFFFFKTPII